ncbi:MAG TPA: hypothetical protein PLJ69_01935 [Methanothrix sp.]|jgi:hypothetical protein|nr:hypothetical protein [Methanothrix sp.]OPX80658.1 MAG: hypothetical protein A4E50_01466 [Methanosaeta sp. PtaB.Bin087]OPY56919.1 MAG: hypothetical protein A4E51_00243 [Methanosaeta sp. PtaU1.Bin055]HNR57165.1 hypothetical protein [Methanothrix sp.]HNT71609.1 hypothetical protein [Methanothrix sp.]
MANLLERKAKEWFGTPEKKARLLQVLVYISNLYVILGVFVLIYVLYGDHLIALWNSLR